MIYRKSFSHPELEVSKCANVRMIGTRNDIQPTNNHSLSINGPTIYYKFNNKTKQVSLRVLVYECWIVERKTKKGEFIDIKNNDEFDCSAENLIRFSKTQNTRDSLTVQKDTYVPYLNGIDEIYMY